MNYNNISEWTDKYKDAVNKSLNDIKDFIEDPAIKEVREGIATTLKATSNIVGLTDLSVAGSSLVAGYNANTVSEIQTKAMKDAKKLSNKQANESAEVDEKTKNVKDKVSNSAKEAFSSMEEDVNTHFKNILNHAESFSSGFKNIFKKLTNDMLALIGKLLIFKKIFPKIIKNVNHLTKKWFDVDLSTKNDESMEDANDKAPTNEDADSKVTTPLSSDKAKPNKLKDMEKKAEDEVKEKTKSIKDKVLDSTKEAFSSMEDDVNTHFRSILNHAESFSSGFKNIFKKLANDMLALIGKLLIYKKVFPKIQKNINHLTKKWLGVDLSEENDESKKDANDNSSIEAMTNSKSMAISSQDKAQPNKLKSAGEKVEDETKKKTKSIKERVLDSTKETFQKMEEDVDLHFRNILNHAESFSGGFKNIFKKLTNDILALMAKLIYYKTIYKPVTDFFYGLIDKHFGDEGTTKKNNFNFDYKPDFYKKWSLNQNNSLSGKAGGGPVQAGKTYLVGEQGMEFFTPSVPGHITPNKEISALPSGQPKVTVNLINQSGQLLQPERQETKFDGEETVINLFLSGYARNVNGIRNIFPVGVR